MLPFFSFSQTTDGSVTLKATVLDYNGSSTRHWVVAWVETEGGTFIKTLRKQGPSIGSSHWNSHCREWYQSKSGSSAIDGYSGATARDYSATYFNPIDITWNCLDAANNLVADGTYKFWIQYAEDNGQGPYTTDGLTWTKGPEAFSTSYPDQAANFANMEVAWTPITPPPVPPTITSAPPPATGVVGVPYQFTSTATGSTPIGFSAAGLPTGLTMSEVGVIAGIPTASGTFSGTLTATNGTPPDATQPFSVVISEVPSAIVSVRPEGLGLVMEGTGPTNGVYSVNTTTDITLPADQWTPLTTGTFDASGAFSITNTPDGIQSRLFYLLSIP